MDKYKNTPKYSFTQMGSSDEIKQIMLDEGFRSRVYKDTEDYRTIGYGFNLDEKSNRKVLKKYLGNKYDYDKLKHKQQGITREDAEILLRGIVADRKRELKREFGASWNKFNAETKNILTNMAYQLGMTRFRGFGKMIRALKKEDYKTGVKEMLDSVWREKNSTARAMRLIKRMKKANNVK